MGIVLRCTGGPCIGETITIESELVLGREEPSPGRLGGDARLSRRHARLYVDDQGRAMIEDLGSTNGTWINEERALAPRELTHGDILRVGHSAFDVELPAAAAVTQVDRDMLADAPTVPETPAPQPWLEVVGGPQQGEQIPLGDELLLGRSYGEPGALGGDRRLSRRHARIARGPGGVFFIEDTGSSNGTLLNGQPVRRAHPLGDGDEIEVGASKLVAHGLPSAPSAVSPEPSAEVSPPYAAPPPPGAEPPHAAMTAAPLPYVPQGAASARRPHRRGRVIAVFTAAVLAAVAAVVLLAARARRFAGPILYDLAARRQPLPPFHHVTLGNNGYYAATPGWNFATGLGTPDVLGLAQDYASFPRAQPPRRCPF